MQITNAASSSLFDSYKLNKKDITEESRIVSRFMDMESQKINEGELIIRPKSDILQSQIEQMKREYLEGGYNNDWLTTSWGSTTATSVLRNPTISMEELAKQYPNYYQATNILEHKYGRDLLDLNYFWNYKQEDSVQKSKMDFNYAINTIENAITQLLEQEFEKDSTSDMVHILTLFKVQIQSIPNIFEQTQQKALQFAEQEGIDLQGLQSESHGVAFAEIVRLESIATRMGNFLPEIKEQLNDSIKTIYDYFYSNGKKDFSISGTPKLQDSGLENVMKFFNLSLISRFSAIDNTEILLNLASDSSLQTNTKESKTYESLIDRIHSKLKGNDDSILQQVMSKITNGVQTAEAGGLRIAN